MRACNPATALLVSAILILMSAATVGGDGMRIAIGNNTTTDLLVTVYDCHGARRARKLTGVNDLTRWGYLRTSIITMLRSAIRSTGIWR